MCMVCVVQQVRGMRVYGVCGTASERDACMVRVVQQVRGMRVYGACGTVSERDACEWCV